jgi:anti-sigma factor RsiW
MIMKCDELQSLHGAYLDSELDARTTLEIQQHLAACPDCARAVAAEAKLEARVAAGLKRGERTTSLWDRIEQRVMTAAEAESRRRSAPQVPQRRPWWHESLWPSPQAWAGLAATWMVLAGVSFAMREPASVTATHQIRPPSPELRLVLQQQKLMLAELSGMPERFAHEKPEAPAPKPHSQRREPFSNT